MGKVRQSFTAWEKLKVIAYAEAHGNRAAGREFSMFDLGDVKRTGYRKSLNKDGKPRSCSFLPSTWNWASWVGLRSPTAGIWCINSRIKITGIQTCEKGPHGSELQSIGRLVLCLNEAPQISNADQTPLTFDLPADTTINAKGASTVSIKTTGKEKKWGRRPGAGKDRSMLVLYAFLCHRSPVVKSVLNADKTDLAIIPGGMTSVLQPLDTSVNKHMKVALQQRWDAWMCGSDHTYTNQGGMRKPELYIICSWIKDAWEELGPEITIARSRNAAFQMPWMNLRMTFFGKTVVHVQQRKVMMTPLRRTLYTKMTVMMIHHSQF